MSGTPETVTESPPRALPGYAHINRYWDRQNDVFAAKILPGEYYVTLTGEMITTVLGSCISACIRDRRLGIGGMNHFMLPVGGAPSPAANNSTAARYGNYAMETLINDILKNGGRRANLEVKIFGGGQVLEQMTRIGDANIRFVREYLEVEHLTLSAEDVGGRCPRKVLYYPDTGRVRVRKLKVLKNETILQREKRYLNTLEKEPASGNVELF